MDESTIIPALCLEEKRASGFSLGMVVSKLQTGERALVTENSLDPSMPWMNILDNEPAPFVVT
jgi:hypothetical protein